MREVLGRGIGSSGHDPDRQVLALPHFWIHYCLVELAD